MKNLGFLQLLLSCSKNQAKALLETSDKSQIKSIVILLINLEKNKAILSTKTRRVINSYKTIFTKLTANRTHDNKNYSLISKNWIKIYNILLASKPVLLKILK